jgi:SPP1 family predicted phage head-tail adaptor
MNMPKTASGVRRKSSTDMNVRVSFLSGANLDNFGNVAAPTVFLTVWANVKAAMSVRGAAILKPDEILQKTNYIVTMRHRTDVDESMIMVIRGAQFTIDNMGDPDGRGVELVMVVSQVDQAI